MEDVNAKFKELYDRQVPMSGTARQLSCDILQGSAGVGQE